MHTPITPSKEEAARQGLPSGGGIGGGIGVHKEEGPVAAAEVVAVAAEVAPAAVVVVGEDGGAGAVGVGGGDKVVMKEPPSLSSALQKEENEMLMVIRPIPILKTKPVAISFIDPSSALAGTNYMDAKPPPRQHSLSVTFSDDQTIHDVIPVKNKNHQVTPNSSSQTDQSNMTAPPKTAPQGGVSSYVQELLSVGVQDRAQGFSRSAQSNRTGRTILGLTRAHHPTTLDWPTLIIAIFD